MKKLFSILFILLFLFSCKNTNNTNLKSDNIYSKNINYEFEYYPNGNVKEVYIKYLNDFKVNKKYYSNGEIQEIIKEDKSLDGLVFVKERMTFNENGNLNYYEVKNNNDELSYVEIYYPSGNLKESIDFFGCTLGEGTIRHSYYPNGTISYSSERCSNYEETFMYFSNGNIEFYEYTNKIDHSKYTIKHYYPNGEQKEGTQWEY